MVSGHVYFAGKDELATVLLTSNADERYRYGFGPVTSSVELNVNAVKKRYYSKPIKVNTWKSVLSQKQSPTYFPTYADDIYSAEGCWHFMRCN